MALVCHPHKFIYLKSIKTAGTSVEMYFEPYRPDALPFTKSTNGKSATDNYGTETIAPVRKHAAWVFERFNYPDHPAQLLPLSTAASPEPVQ